MPKNEEVKERLLTFTSFANRANTNKKKYFFSLNNFYPNKKNKNYKGRDKPDFSSFIQTTINLNNNPFKRKNKNLNCIKNTKSEKKFSELFSINPNYKKNKNNNDILTREISSKDSKYFTKIDKKRIYKNYFSVDYKRNNISKINYSNNEKIKNNFIKKENSPINRITHNSCKKFNKKKIGNSTIYQKDIILEIDKYKRKINNLKKTISIKNAKLRGKQDENNKLKILIENKRNNKKKIKELIKLLNNSNLIQNNNNSKNDLLNLINKIKEEYIKKKLINKVINLIKCIYIENNISSSSNESKKNINFKKIVKC